MKKNCKSEKKLFVLFQTETILEKLQKRQIWLEIVGWKLVCKMIANWLQNGGKFDCKWIAKLIVMACSKKLIAKSIGNWLHVGEKIDCKLDCKVDFKSIANWWQIDFKLILNWFQMEVGNGSWQ